MKIRKAHLKTVALAVLGVVVGRGAQADTVLTFDAFPAGQANNQPIIQTFGDTASTSSEGVQVNGFGTPNIGLTWQATGGRWDFYIDTVWASGQLDSSNVGDVHEVVFKPNNPAAQVVLKSFNFFPYYLSSERYTYAVSVVSNGSVVSGPTNITFLADNTPTHPVSLNYTGAAGQELTLRIARLGSTLEEGEVEGGSGNIAIDDLTFAQIPETELSSGPTLFSINPANNAAGVIPEPVFRAVINDGSTSVDTGTVVLRLNGNAVTASATNTGGATTITYQGTGVFPALSTNRFVLTYADTGSPARSYTNETQFVVAGYVNKVLPAPFVFQDFDAVPEGSLPAGWTSSGAADTSASALEIDFGNLDSAAYTNWTVVDVSRFNGEFVAYSDPADITTDYQRVLTPNPSNVVNGAFVRNLGSGRMLFANSGYRNGSMGVVQFLFTPDFDLTGKTDVYVAFHSLWEQNQDSIAAVEYSTDRGATWLPIVYMIDQVDVVTNATGGIDAETTLNSPYGDLATWTDEQGAPQGGYYGAFIGVPFTEWSTLAPYISPRVDDSASTSKRVEVFRLPQADNMPAVRFRFAHAGTDSWYWGIDNFGLYSIPEAAPSISSITRNGNNVVLSWPGAPGLRLQQTASLSAPNWQDVPGTEGASNATVATTGAAGFFRLAR